MSPSAKSRCCEIDTGDNQRTHRIREKAIGRARNLRRCLRTAIILLWRVIVLVELLFVGLKLLSGIVSASSDAMVLPEASIATALAAEHDLGS
ncbi:hypothetical protein NDU88_005435 [Pleurodeles waltl]|uniref:Uncharacterized protein n=1 Tax=Pleurodeles waltl TaxID=8319 RepID=A0AAV7WUP7_PLEWA|nr:hypothetical protein NDU88_005435 [Pleurodeles waltl]